MTREEAVAILQTMEYELSNQISSIYCRKKYDAIKIAIEALEQEPCCNCIEFKRYAKQMGFSIKKVSIPYLMHKEMDIPISECQKAYDVAIDYLRNQSKMKG